MGKSGNLEISIVTPEKVVYHDSNCDYVSIPAVEGVIGVYAGHIPLFTKINQGELKVVKGKETAHLSVAGGFVEVTKDHVTILADSALRSEDLDEELIMQAKRKAEEQLSQKISRREYIAAEATLRKTMLDLKVAERKKKSLIKRP